MRYTFSSSESLLKDVEIYKEGKGLRAILTAPDGGDVEALAELKRDMQARGFSVIADVQDGKDVLRIKGLKSAETFLSTLAEDGGVTGDYGVEITDREIKEKKSFGDMIKDNALTLSGVLYLMADSCIITSSVVRGALEPDGDKEELMNGILWWIPSFFLIAAGNQDVDAVNGFLKRDMKDAFDEMGVKVPASVMRNLEAGAAEHGMWDKFVETVYAHGPIMNNVMQVMGAQKMFSAGQNQSNFGKMSAGLVMGSGMALGAVLPEHKEYTANSNRLGEARLMNGDMLAQSNLSIKDTTTADELNESLEVSKVIAPDKQQGGLLSKINPLTISGAGAIYNNVANIIGAWDEIREWTANKTWLGKDKPLNENIAKPFLDENRQLHSKVNYDFKAGQLNEAFDQADIRFKQAILNVSDDARRKFNSLQDTSYKEAADQLSPQARLDIASELKATSPELLDAHNNLNAAKAEKAAFDKQYEDRSRSVKASPWNLVAQGLYLLANRCYMMSSKENSADLDQVGGINDLMAISANIVASYPKDKQAEMTERLAVMVTESKYVDYTIADVASVIGAKVEALNNSVWLGNAKTAITELNLKAAELTDDRKISNAPSVEASPEERQATMLRNLMMTANDLGVTAELLNARMPEADVTSLPAQQMQEFAQTNGASLASQFAAEVERRTIPDSAMDTRDPAFSREGRISEQELALNSR
jgi:hypothetical protein